MSADAGGQIVTESCSTTDIGGWWRTVHPQLENRYMVTAYRGFESQSLRRNPERKSILELFWQHTKRGQRLVLSSGDGQEEEVGGVRETRRGFDAFAKTFGYDPGRAEKGILSMDEAKTFVESFRPWELFVGPEGLTVEAEVRPQAS